VTENFEFFFQRAAILFKYFLMSFDGSYDTCLLVNWRESDRKIAEYTPVQPR